jgi:ABC-type transport system substrate-binding protein
MQKNFVASLVQSAVMLLFAALVAYSVVQVNHLERLVVETRKSVETVQDTVSKLESKAASGQFASAPSGGRAPADAGGPGGWARRYFTDEDWANYNRPGNMLKLPEQPTVPANAVSGGTIQRAFVSDIPGLNYITENAADVTELYAYVSDGLAERDRTDPDRWIPRLAVRIEVTPDHKAYHIWLRKGVKWHRPSVDFTNPRYKWLDGERELKADDFAFMVELANNPQVEAPHYRNYFEKLDRVEVLNDYEFVVHWKVSEYTSIATTLGLFPYPRWLYGFDEDGHAFDPAEIGRRFNDHWYNQRAIGVGPYRFVSWQQGGSIVLERNEQFYGEKPPIERIEFKVINDATARLNNLRAGGLDYIPLQPNQYRKEVVEGGTEGFKNGELQQQAFQGTSYRYLGWNADGAFFSDRRVRLAMTHAFNRQLMLDENMNGLGRLISGPFFIDGPDYDQSIQPWPFDLARAAELLDQAGWRDSDGNGIREKVVDGKPVEFVFGMLAYSYRPEFVAAMETFRNDLRKIGVVMNIEPVEWAIMVRRMEEKDFDAFTGGWQLGWDTDLYQIWHSSQADQPKSSNRIGFRNQEADKIIEGVRLEFDPQKRNELFSRFHHIVHEEQPYTFWFAPRDVGAWRSHVRNVNFSAIRPFDLGTNWFISEQP